MDHAGLSSLGPVLITGGAGFIGSHIARAYVERGWRTVVVDDLSTGHEGAVPPGADLEVVDVRHERFTHLVRSVRPVLIVHAAAQVSVAASIHDPEEDRSRNVVGTERVAEAARLARARLVFLSSGGAVYGETRGAAEDDPPRPSSPYGRHKLEAEQVVRSAGVSFATLRLANVYGPGQRADLEGGVVARFVQQLSRGLPVTIFGDGLQTRDFIHVGDVVSAVLLLGGAAASGTWNVGTGVATTIRALLSILERIVGPAVEVRYEAPRPGEVRHSRLVIDRLSRLAWVPSIRLEEGLLSVATPHS